LLARRSARDDHLIMCLRFLIPPDHATSRVAGSRLSRREETWKTAEILILRHQLAVLQRRQPRHPKLNWADRALLAALLGAIPQNKSEGGLEPPSWWYIPNRGSITTPK